MHSHLGRFGAGLTTALLVTAHAVAGPERVSLPSGYKDHVTYLTADRPFNDTVRVFYASPGAAKSVRSGRPLPRGSVVTMEVYKAEADARGRPVKGADGRFTRGELVAIMVMEKRSGWGAEYPKDIRNGEWEYAEFRPDGSRHEPSDTRACLECHKQVSKQDFVFTFSALVANKEKTP